MSLRYMVLATGSVVLSFPKIGNVGEKLIGRTAKMHLVPDMVTLAACGIPEVPPGARAAPLGSKEALS